jgi:GNAT superfamily N-acetyltransferase
MSENTIFRVRPMTMNDLDQAMGLSVVEGWNQTDKDWKLLLENPENVCIAAETGGRIIGTATALNHSGKVAWIGMVLVDKSMRGLGAGKMLMTEIIGRLDIMESVKLDATPAGHPLYRSMGFIDECSIHRMSTPALKSIAYRYAGDKPKKITPATLPEITARDASVFGADRGNLLNTLYKNLPEKAFAFEENKGTWGYIFGRTGTNFNYIGPACAGTPEAAKGLIAAALEPFHSKPVAIDVHADKTELITWLETIGFVKQRDFIRMYLGKNPHPGKPEFQYLIAGPEFG